MSRQITTAHGVVLTARPATERHRAVWDGHANHVDDAVAAVLEAAGVQLKHYDVLSLQREALEANDANAGDFVTVEPAGECGDVELALRPGLHAGGTAIANNMTTGVWAACSYAFT